MTVLSGRAREELRRAAVGGEVAAQREWGKLLLSFQPPNYREAMPFIEKAARAGDGEASYIVALHASSMAQTDAEWAAVLVQLDYAADAGCAEAQRDRALLRRESARMDAAALLASPQPNLVRTAPRIATIEAFMTAAECDFLIARAAPKLEPARLYDPTAGYRTDPVRSNSAVHFPFSQSDMVMHVIQGRIARAAGLPTDGCEACTVLHYTAGQEFKPHFDFQDSELYGHLVARLGQRVVTFLVYLNDAFEGGETDFPLIDWRFRGRKGEAILVWNVTPDGRGDTQTRHAGMPPTRGEKWLLSQWIRDRNRPGLNKPW